nr:uncharacterized protein LOC109167327 [Ipomoea trifida]
MKYLTHDYKTMHVLDAVEFYAKACLRKDEIRSTVSGTDIVSFHGDIKALFLFLYMRFSFKKKSLKPEYKRAIGILSQIIENKVVGLDDVTIEKFTMLSALLNNYLVDWSMVIFNFSHQFIEKAVDMENKTPS